MKAKRNFYEAMSDRLTAIERKASEGAIEQNPTCFLEIRSLVFETMQELKKGLVLEVN